MDLSTTYLGLKLGTPLIVGASPFADDVYAARQLQDAGAGAIVMRSLFEEQIYLDALSSGKGKQQAAGEENGSFPAPWEYQLNPDKYLKQISDLKSALTIPVIASLNGCSPGGWIDFARRFEAAGADAIELNLYHLSTDPRVSALEVENELLETVKLIKATTKVPIAVKLQPFYTALAHFAMELEKAGADGLVIFTSLYQSDISVDEQERVAKLRLSDPTELLVRLRWLSALSPHLRCSLGLTGGVHGGDAVIKGLLAGANAVQLVSVVLKHGPHILTAIAQDLRRWMEDHRYRSLSDFRGSLSTPAGQDTPSAERADYQRLLQMWKM